MSRGIPEKDTSVGAPKIGQFVLRRRPKPSPEADAGPALREGLIISSAPMVRAILAGAKTQARRVMEPQPHPEFLARGVVGAVPQWPLQYGVRWFMADGMSELVKCPYGGPGGRLWVGETLVPAVIGLTLYAEDGTFVRIDGQDIPWPWPKAKSVTQGCPRWASRITLELTDVRVQRVQEISDEDALAEGVGYGEPDNYVWIAGRAINKYRTLWDMSNAKCGYPWASNPWVWTLTFRDARADAASGFADDACIGGGEQAAPDRATEARSLLSPNPGGAS